MEKVKISTLNPDTIILEDSISRYLTVSEVLENIEEYKSKELYTTTQYYARFDAKSILEDAVENEYDNVMYEDWDDSILGDITDEDISDF